MRIFFLTCFLLFALNLTTVAQEIFIKTGINSTTYDFKSSTGANLLEFIPGIGSSIEMGIGFPFLEKVKEEDKEKLGPAYSPNWFKNEVALNMDSYNSFGGNLNNNYGWETTYGGVTNTLSFLTHKGEIEFGLRGILGVSGLIAGTQVINNSRFTLKDQADFSGVFLRTGGGASVSYPVFQRGFLNLSYSYSKSARLGGPSEERVSFLTHRFLFGLYVQLN